MRSFVCDVCHEYIQHERDQATERVEFRSQDGNSRIAVVTVKHLCRTCVGVRLKELKETDGVEAQALF